MIRMRIIKKIKKIFNQLNQIFQLKMNFGEVFGLLIQLKQKRDLFLNNKLDKQNRIYRNHLSINTTKRFIITANIQLTSFDQVFSNPLKQLPSVKLSSIACIAILKLFEHFHLKQINFDRMSNLAISKRSGSILSRKESREQSVSQQKNIRNFDELDQKQFSVIQASSGHTNLFNSFKLNTEKQKVPLGIQLGAKNPSNQEQKSTPLFYKASREQQFIEQTSFEQSTREWKQSSYQKLSKEKVKNKLIGKALESVLNEFQNDDDLQVNSIKYMDKKQDDYKITFSNERENLKGNQQFNRNEFDNDDLQFGSGLEQIGKNQRELDMKDPKNCAPKGFFDIMPSVQKLHSSTFTPSNNSRISNRPIPSADRLSAGPSFFKRPLSSTHSQSYLKSYQQQQLRSNSKQQFNKGRQSVNPYNYRDPKRGSLTNYRTVGRDRNESAYSYRNQFVSMFHDGHQGTVRKRQDVCLSLANNLTMLLFKYNGGHASTLYNYRLKLKNESSYRIGFKIKCTSPRHYEVRPYSEGYLGPSQILNVSIELKLSLHDLDPIRMKHDLSHYKRDKFKIEYWTAECQNDMDYSEGEKILPVVIDQTEEEKLRNQGLTRSISENSMKLATEENEILVYRKLIDRNNLIAKEMNEKIHTLQSQKFSHRHYTKQLFLLFVIIGLGIGVWLG